MGRPDRPGAGQVIFSGLPSGSVTEISRGTALPADSSRAAEEALRRFGYARVRPGRSSAGASAEFWVQEPGVPRRTYPVFVAPGGGGRTGARVEDWIRELGAGPKSPSRAIVVVPDDRVAEEAWRRLGGTPHGRVDSELSILVVPPKENPEAPAHWHWRVVEPRELLWLATGVVVGLFRRGVALEGSGQVDFEEMLELLKNRFRLDVQRSLGVRSDEDALFLLYQLAVRDTYAPGDPGANLHLLVLRPTGPAARVPWFAG